MRQVKKQHHNQNHTTRRNRMAGAVRINGFKDLVRWKLVSPKSGDYEISSTGYKTITRRWEGRRRRGGDYSGGALAKLCVKNGHLKKITAPIIPWTEQKNPFGVKDKAEAELYNMKNDRTDSGKAATMELAHRAAKKETKRYRPLLAVAIIGALLSGYTIYNSCTI